MYYSQVITIGKQFSGNQRFKTKTMKNVDSHFLR